GTGLCLAQIYAKKGYNVIGTSRSTDLDVIAELNKVAAKVYPLDVSDHASIAALTGRVQLLTPSLDILINNAGAMAMDSIKAPAGKLAASLAMQFNINTVAPVLVTQALLALLKSDARVGKDGDRTPKVAQMSSTMGSITNNGSGGYYGCRASKAALNMVTASLARDIPDVAFVLLHPGFVKTRMTGGKGEVTPEVSAAMLYDVVARAQLGDSASFSRATARPSRGEFFFSVHGWGELEQNSGIEQSKKLCVMKNGLF
ncbi:hypothetical protein BC828DRAFT_351750, partial [Blastocladiella britannica]